MNPCLARRVARAALALAALAPLAQAAEASAIFERRNLVAWCIVPFDARKRGPEERAEMLRRLGFTHFAYDWRGEHIAQFDEEMETLKRFGVELDAFWFPGAMNREAEIILDCLRRHGLKTQLWVTMDLGGVEADVGERERRVQRGADAVRPIAEAAGRIGCTVGLYNHGGWFGEPENQIAIIERLALPNVGIVYNQHHGHAHVARFPELLAKMKPHLYALNLNGMDREGDAKGRKILPLGQGELDLELLRAIEASGYRGRIGILGHTESDAEITLRDNLDGLDWLAGQLKNPDPARARPKPRSAASGAAFGAGSLSERFGRALAGGMVVGGSPEFGIAPLTVECRARLQSASGFNILVASQTKASGAHWEIFTWPGTGALTVYMPGMAPDHVRSERGICDGQWHAVTMTYEAERVRLFVDGELAADQAAKRNAMPAAEGGLAFGRLVEGGIGCDGFIDDIRISRGAFEPGKPGDAPLARDDRTLGLWGFDDLPDAAPRADLWEVEDPAIRAAMPERYVIPAARADELTPALAGLPAGAGADWPRSHADAGSTRYSRLNEIDRANVARLEPAWVYRSGEEKTENVQCNPVIVGGVIFAPTAGDRLVAIDGASGRELWSFRGEGRPALRGLVYWPGTTNSEPRILFNSGEDLWALRPADGKPIEGFGEHGRVRTGAVAVAGAVHDGVLVIPGLAGDVFGHDAATGKRLWTFHTIPREGEFGSATWSAPEEGANCWGGMALDEARGIAYVATGSPKPNFVGVGHHGSNLFSNCVIALEAKSGRLLWHFQEIRHDLWDMDIPAPPNLVPVERDGRRVDAVAQVTKLGNTLLLDRVTGKPLFPVTMRRAPASKLPGERTWPYQPDIELPQPFARQAFTPDDVTTRTQDAREFVQGLIANARSGWFEPFEEGKPTVYYGIHGGAEWTGAAVDLANSRLYVAANHIPWNITVFSPDEAPRDPSLPPTEGEKVYQANCAKCHGADRIGVGMGPPLQGLKRRMSDGQVKELLATGRNSMPAAELTTAETAALLDFLFLRDRPEAAEPAPPRAPSYTSNGYPKLLDHEGYPGSKPPWGTLNCIDLNSGRLVWKRPLGEYPALAEAGLRGLGAENFGGAIVTAGGLVFCAGTPDRKLRAFAAEDGRELWAGELPFGGYAPPATYQAAGRQFVAIAATGGGKLGGETGDAWVAFALPTARQE